MYTQCIGKMSRGGYKYPVFPFSHGCLWVHTYILYVIRVGEQELNRFYFYFSTIWFHHQGSEAVGVAYSSICSQFKAARAKNLCCTTTSLKMKNFKFCILRQFYGKTRFAYFIVFCIFSTKNVFFFNQCILNNIQYKTRYCITQMFIVIVTVDH